MVDADPVADEVEALAGLGGEGVGHELARGLGGSAQVAAGQAAAGGRHLARHPGRHQLQEAIEHVGLGRADGPAQGDGAVDLFGALDALAGDHHRGLGWAIAVVEPGAGVALEEAAGVALRHDVTAAEQLGQAAQVLKALLDHGGEQGGGEERESDFAGQQEGAQLVQRQGLVGVDFETTAVEQDRPDLEGRGIERERCQLQADGGGREGGVAAGQGQAQHARVGQAGGLGLAGRARGVDQVGQLAILRRQAERVALQRGGDLLQEDGFQRGLGRELGGRGAIREDQAQAAVADQVGQTLGG